MKAIKTALLGLAVIGCIASGVVSAETSQETSTEIETTTSVEGDTN